MNAIKPKHISTMKPAVDTRRKSCCEQLFSAMRRVREFAHRKFYSSEVKDFLNSECDDVSLSSRGSEIRRPENGVTKMVSGACLEEKDSSFQGQGGGFGYQETPEVPVDSFAHDLESSSNTPVFIENKAESELKEKYNCLFEGVWNGHDDDIEDHFEITADILDLVKNHIGEDELSKEILLSRAANHLQRLHSYLNSPYSLTYEKAFSVLNIMVNTNDFSKEVFTLLTLPDNLGSIISQEIGVSINQLANLLQRNESMLSSIYCFCYSLFRWLDQGNVDPEQEGVEAEILFNLINLDINEWGVFFSICHVLYEKYDFIVFDPLLSILSEKPLRWYLSKEAYEKVWKNFPDNVEALEDPDNFYQLLTYPILIGVEEDQYPTCVREMIDFLRGQEEHDPVRQNVPRIAFAERQNTHTAAVNESCKKAIFKLHQQYGSLLAGRYIDKSLVRQFPSLFSENDIGKTCNIENISRTIQQVFENRNESIAKKQLALSFIRRIYDHDIYTSTTAYDISQQRLLTYILLASCDVSKIGNEISFDSVAERLTDCFSFMEGGDIPLGYAVPNRLGHICAEGTIHGLVNALNGIHPDCTIHFYTQSTASCKLPIVIREELNHYLQSCSDIDRAAIIRRLEEAGAITDDVGTSIYKQVADRIYDEFGEVFLGGRESTDFIDFINAGITGLPISRSDFPEDLQI